MKDVHFVQRDQVDVSLHIFYTKEVTGYVKHRPPPWVLRIVTYSSGGDFPFNRVHGIRLHRGRKQLTQRLYAPKQSGARVGANVYTIGVDINNISFLSKFFVLDKTQRDRLAGGSG